jgi:hypothetical protein
MDHVALAGLRRRWKRFALNGRSLLACIAASWPYDFELTGDWGGRSWLVDLHDVDPFLGVSYLPIFRPTKKDTVPLNTAAKSACDQRNVSGGTPVAIKFK